MTSFPFSLLLRLLLLLLPPSCHYSISFFCTLAHTTTYAPALAHPPSRHRTSPAHRNGRPIQTHRRPQLACAQRVLHLPDRNLPLHRHPRHHHRQRTLHPPAGPPVPLRQLPQSSRLVREFELGDREREGRGAGSQGGHEAVRGLGDGEREEG